MREMLKMLSELLIEQSSVEKGAGFVLNGQSKSVGSEGLKVVQEDHQQLQGLQRLYLSSISTHIILALGIWKGNLSHGKIASVRIRRNFAFVQYDLQDDVTRALEATNTSKLIDSYFSGICCSR